MGIYFKAGPIRTVMEMFGLIRMGLLLVIRALDGCRQSVTHVSGIRCYLCLRKDKTKTRLEIRSDLLRKYLKYVHSRLLSFGAMAALQPHDLIGMYALMKLLPHSGKKSFNSSKI